MKIKTIICCLLCLFVVMAVTDSADAKKRKTDYTKHPGYIEMPDFGNGDEAKIEVNLNENMIKLVAKFLKGEDPELYDMLINLKLVRVEVYELSAAVRRKFASQSSRAVEVLDDNDWERIVRVREDDQQAYVYIKPSDDYEWIQGIVVLAMEDDEAVFVNIVGDIKPEDISRIGEHFDRAVHVSLDNETNFLDLTFLDLIENLLQGDGALTTAGVVFPLNLVAFERDITGFVIIQSHEEAVTGLRYTRQPRNLRGSRRSNALETFFPVVHDSPYVTSVNTGYDGLADLAGTALYENGGNRAASFFQSSFHDYALPPD